MTPCSSRGTGTAILALDTADATDLISRLSELRCQYNCFDENERDAYHTLSEAIKALSDVPDTNVGDTISRQWVIDEIHKGIYELFDMCDDDESPFTQKDKVLLEVNKSITERIRKLPVREVVLCRECKWSKCYICIDKFGNTETAWRCQNWFGETEEEGFCHEGERYEL